MVSEVMIAILKQLLPRIETWSEEDQAAVAEFAREIEAGRTGVYEMSGEERQAVEEGIAEAERGEFATEAEITSIRQRFAPK